MSRLILTEKEKQSATYLDWNDAALGRAVKSLALAITDHKGEKSLANTACAVMLAAMVAERDEQGITIDLSGVHDGEKQVGDWKIVISRSTTPSKKVRSKILPFKSN